MLSINSLLLISKILACSLHLQLSYADIYPCITSFYFHWFILFVHCPTMYIYQEHWVITFMHYFIQNLKNLHFLGEGTSANFLSFSTFWIPFTPNWLKMTHNSEFSQKCWLDWLKMANFGHFAGFSP